MSSDLSSAFRASPRGTGPLRLLRRLHPTHCVRFGAAYTPEGGAASVRGGARFQRPYPPDPLSSGLGSRGSRSECANGRAVLMQTLSPNWFTLVSAI